MSSIRSRFKMSYALNHLDFSEFTDLEQFLTNKNGQNEDSLVCRVKNFQRKFYQFESAYEGRQQNYCCFFVERKSRTQGLAKHAELRKKGLQAKPDSLLDLKKTLLDPQMIGLRMPQTDLEHLRDFTRIILQGEELDEQDFLIEKLDCFLTYLVMVKQKVAWRPHQTIEDIRGLQDRQLKFSACPWIQDSLIASRDFMSNRGQAHQSTYFTEVQYRDRINTTQTSNPNFQPGEYSIWDRMCTEEFRSMLSTLNERHSEALPEVCATITGINGLSEFFDEILKGSDLAEAERLVKSRLELLKECQELSKVVSNLESPKVSLTDRVKVQIRLAEVTLDVNHLLSALIYLTKAFQSDLEALGGAQDQAVMSGESDFVLAQILPELGSAVDFSKVFSLVGEEAPIKRFPPTVNDTPLSKNTPFLQNELVTSKLFSSDFFKKLTSENDGGFAEVISLNLDETTTSDQKQTTLLEIMVFVAHVLYNACKRSMKTREFQDGFFEKMLFSSYSVHQKNETFKNLDRLAKLLLQIVSQFETLETQKPLVQALHQIASFVSMAVSEVLQTNLYAVINCKKAKQLDTMLARGNESVFAGLTSNANSFELLIDALYLSQAFAGSISKASELVFQQMTGSAFDPQSHERADSYDEMDQAPKLQELLPYLYEISKPEHLHKVLSALSFKQKAKAEGEPADTAALEALLKDEAILELVTENCDLVSTLPSESDSEETRQLRAMLENLSAKFLEGGELDKSNRLSRRQHDFFNRYLAHQFISIVESDSLEDFKQRLLELIKKLSEGPQTKWASQYLYQTFLTMLSKKELVDDPEMIKALFDIARDQPNFSSVFIAEIQLLRGSKIFSLFEPNDSESDAQDLSEAQQQILKSQLLSGGLPLRLFAYFDSKKLSKMIKDAKAGGPINDDLVSQLELALEKAEVKVSFKMDEEKFLEQVILEGKHIAIDAICEALQLALMQKGGQVAGYCQAGQSVGMALTRAAFAVLIKFQGLSNVLQELVDSAQNAIESSMPAEAGQARNGALLGLLDDCIDREDILTCWQNSTKMRRWLLHKKQLISQKLEFEDDTQKKEEAKIKDVVAKVVEKARMLTFLQQPKVPFKAEKDLEQLSKLSSSLKSVSWQTDDVYDLNNKVLSAIGRKKFIEQAGTASVLACLQTPIEAHMIKAHIATASHSAIRRLSAFQLICEFMRESVKDELTKPMIGTLVFWLNYWQSDSFETKHYTDGLEGCGAFFETALQSIYFDILQMVADCFEETNDAALATVLLKGFNCKFKANEFQFLAQTIQVFPLLTRSRKSADQQSLVNWSLDENAGGQAKLKANVTGAIQEIFMAIISRITHGDEVQQVTLGDQTQKLTKRISLIDINWAEQIIFDALSEFFLLLGKDEEQMSDPLPFLCLIYLLLNVAQVHPFLRNIVKKFFKKEHASVLLKLFKNGSTDCKLNCLKIFDCLLRFELAPTMQHSEAICNSTELGLLAKQFCANPLASYFLERAVELRATPSGETSEQFGIKHQYAISKLLVKLVRSQVIAQTEVEASVETSIASLADFSQAERSVLFDILGAALETCSLEDEVRFHSRRELVHKRSKEDSMVVKPFDCAFRGRHKLKVYSEVQGEQVKVNKGEIQIVHHSATLPRIAVSIESLLQLVALLEAEDTDSLTLACLLKYFLKNEPENEEVRAKLVSALTKLRSERLAGVVGQAKSQWTENSRRDKKKDVWSDAHIGVLALEEHLMTRAIAQLEQGESFVGKKPKLNYLDSSEEDEDENAANCSEQEELNAQEDNHGALNLDLETGAMELEPKPQREAKHEALKDGLKQPQKQVEVGSPRRLLFKNYYKRSLESQQMSLSRYRTNGAMRKLGESIVQEMFRGDNQSPVVRVSQALQMRMMASIVLAPAQKRPEFIALLDRMTKPIHALDMTVQVITRSQKKKVEDFVFEMIVRRFFSSVASYESMEGKYLLTQDMAQKLQLQNVLNEASEGMDEVTNMLRNLEPNQQGVSIQRAEEEDIYDDYGGYHGGHGEGESEGDDSSSNRDFIFRQDNFKRKILRSSWDNFKPISRIQASKTKQRKIKLTQLTKYYRDIKLTRQYYLMEKSGASAQECMAAKLLASKLAEALLYERKAAADETLKLYLERKLVKVTNYSCFAWTTQQERFDGQVVEQYMRKLTEEAKFDRVMTLPEVEAIFSSLDNVLFKEKSPKMINMNLLTQINLLRKVAKVLAQSGDATSVIEHAVTVTDGLLKSIWWMTIQLRLEGKKGQANLLYLNIRKVFSTLLFMAERLRQEADLLAQRGKLLEVTRLESVRQLNMLLPGDIFQLRNMFQFLLAETFYALYQTRKAALSSELVEEATRQHIKLQSLPFEELMLQMERVKTCLADTHLLGHAHGTIKTELKVDKFSLSELERVGQSNQDPQGWYKININQPGQSIQKVLRISVKQGQSQAPYFGKVAISAEPKWTEETQIYDLRTKKGFDDEEHEAQFVKMRKLVRESIFIKYPLPEDYNVLMIRATSDKSQAECSRRKKYQKNEQRDWSCFSWFQLYFDQDRPSLLIPAKDGKNLLYDDVSQQRSSQKIRGLEDAVQPTDKIVAFTQQLAGSNSLLRELASVNGTKTTKERSNAKDFVGMTQNGHLFHFNAYQWTIDQYTMIETKYYLNNDNSLVVYPQLHSDLPPSRISKVLPFPNQLFALTKDGEIFAALTKEKAEKYKVGQKCMVTKLEKPQLEDGSRVARFTHIEVVSKPIGTLIEGRLYALAVTSAGATIVLAQEADCLKMSPTCAKAADFTSLVRGSDRDCFTTLSDAGQVCHFKDASDSEPTLVALDDNVKAQSIKACENLLGIQGICKQTGHKRLLLKNLLEDSAMNEKDKQLDKQRELIQEKISSSLHPLLDEGHYELRDFTVISKHDEESDFYCSEVMLLLLHTSVPQDLEIELSYESTPFYEKPELPELTESLKVKNELLLKRWSHSVDLQLKKNHTKVYSRVQHFVGHSDFVLKYFKQYFKTPKLREGELPEEESKELHQASSGESETMRRFVVTCLKTQQLLYDLMPLASALSCDPYLEQCPQMKLFMASYTSMSDRLQSEIIKQAQIELIQKTIPTYSQTVIVRVRRIKANEFWLKNRFETATERCTMFSQFMRQFKNPEKWKQSTRRPFHITFINEGACDAGGPMRDSISNLCKEITSSVLPLLLPTANNLVRMEPSMECFRLNPNSLQPHMLAKFTWLGYFLGWSLRAKGGLAIDLPLCLWRRILKGSQNYVYTVEDMREMDVFRAEMLLLIRQHACDLDSDEVFAVFYEGYTFTASFETENDEKKVVELCEGGTERVLTRDNAEEFIRLYLKKYTEQDAVQFQHLWLAIQDCVGETMLAHLSASEAANRTSAKPFITTAAFKAGCRIHVSSSEEGQKNLKWFWEIFDEMSKKDRELLLKFMSGDSRLKEGNHYSISMGYGQAGFPQGHTCNSNMSVPFYKDKETAKRNMLTAFRLCGEIDLDGGGGAYGQEVESDQSDHGFDDYGAEDRDSDSDSEYEPAIQFYSRGFPVQARLEHDNEQERRYQQEPNWELRELNTDDEANEPILVDLPSEEEE